MKHKIVVITNDQGKVVGALRSEMKRRNQKLSFHPSPYAKHTYHELEVEEEFFQQSGETLKRDLASRIVAKQKASA
jgi:uncharacterized protein YjbK